MTVCISSIGKSDNGEEVMVLGADKMLTNSYLEAQFEHPISKYKQIGDRFVCMLAGNPLIFDETLKVVSVDDKYEEALEKIQKNLLEMYYKRIERELLNAYRVTWAFVEEALKSPIENQYMDQLMKKILEYTLGTDIMLTGFSGKEARMSTVSEGGTIQFREIGFAVIGSGYTEATNTLLFQRQSRDTPLRETVYNVFKAKRNAEVSSGVGKETDFIIQTKKSIKSVKKEDMERLSKIYDEELEYGKKHKYLDELAIMGEI